MHRLRSQRMFDIEKILYVGELCVRKNLKVLGKSKFSTLVVTDATIKGYLNVNKDVNVLGNIGIGNRLDVAGNVDMENDLNVSENVVIGNNLNVSGNVEFSQDLTVDGTTTMNNQLNVNSNVDATGSINANGGIYSNNNLLLPPGTIMPYAGSSSPGGYLICNGSAVSRSTYSSLFTIIATTYGAGDGSTTFNLPNLSGRMIMGVSGSHTLSSTGGSETQSLSVNQIPSHTHTGTTDSNGDHTHSISDPGHVHARLNGRDDGNSSNIAGQAPSGDASPNITGYPTQPATTGISINSSGAHTHSFTTNSTGSGNSFSILNPFITLNYIIKI